jgi:decaprenyl-phosphate phosphoribosyltransferase
MLRAIVKSVRPHQWVKNLFVAAPAVFARRLGDGQADLRCAAAFAIFCLLSSAVYLANDLVDLEKDRAHPVKRRRPIASGAISEKLARALAMILALGALAAACGLGFPFALVATGYLLLNWAYSLVLKKIAFIDVTCLSLFFLLRVSGGAVAIPVPLSRWLLGCTLLLSALLGFGKRAHELRVAGESGRKQRDVLGSYNPRVLRPLLFLLGIATTVTYFAYTRSPHARELFGTDRLIFTVPFVAFGVHRFIRIVGRQAEAESPTDSMLRDVPFVANLFLYAAAAVAVLYLAP